MIRNVVFDMGRVLLDFEPQRFLDLHVEREEDKRLLRGELFGNVEWVRSDEGTITDEELVRGVCARVPERLHASVKELCAHWFEEMEPYPQMEPLLRALHAAGYKLFLLSNVSHHYAQMRARIPAIELFDGEFLSSDWKLLKPDPQIYRTFCLHFGLTPSECFFVDDRGDNVYGAMRAGMQGTVYTMDVQALSVRLRQAGIKL